MERAYYEMQWPRENLYLACYSHEILNYRYHWHQTEYELDILLSGEQEFCRGTEKIRMAEDDVILVEPNTGHASFALAENTRALVLRFSASAFRPFLKKGFGFSFPGCRSGKDTRQAPGYRQLRAFAARLLLAASAGGPYGQLTAKASMEMLLSSLLGFFPPRTVEILPEQDEQHMEVLHRLILYLEGHYMEKLTLEDLARFSQYNRTYVSTLFKNMAGINFHEYLMRIRFQHALFDLAGSGKTLTEIAVNNGFSDLKSFNRRFQETFHYSPAEYRKRVADGQISAAFRSRSIVPVTDRIVYEKLKEYAGELPAALLP